MNYDLEILYGILGFLFMIVLIALLIGAVLYVLYSIGLYSLAKNRELSNPWLAWIPVARVYVLGAIGDSIERRSNKTTYWRFILLAIAVISTFFSGIPQSFAAVNILSNPYNVEHYIASMIGSSFFFWLLPIAFYILELIVMYKIFHEYRPGSATTFTVLGAIISNLRYIFIFVVRNDTPKNGGFSSGGYTQSGQNFTIPGNNYEPAQESEPWNQPPEQ